MLHMVLEIYSALDTVLRSGHYKGIVYIPLEDSLSNGRDEQVNKQL